ncbi:diacylglycerol O-acyltransferase [Mycobacterium sp. 1482292.6]|uniref:WS/DGAT/MGAT family O-acyltransferase n=1 Tax=unclassified Mycobacterium TaxID=2642494 RepID=UPI0008019E27|nr:MULTISPECIES: wax ester/triacylglycerol synthase family O-acyltransferase [unclassified Mycobacterium]OBJ11805.1 diacylglycerol O-acyltransferase [Mycobacterium sp. 1482292.6]OBJ26055.1 diacylglycerol O-acyltransferase [Mycobacterium sp. 1245801.1]OBK10102.1 diacylglycerol O-acyltransferase [Mycobacterium sp. 1245852.3]
MEPISPMDALFLIGESREHPMHVGSLQLFEPPEDADPHFVREAYQAMLQCTDVQPSFRKHPAFFGGITNVAWSFDKDVELDYHLRRSALPEPGRVRDLLELASRLHGSLLDRHRPMWEAHLVEGLQDGRYAVYTKYHHSLMDGVSALRLVQRAFTPDPDDDEVRVPWSLGPRKRSGRREQSSLFDRVGRTAGSALALAPSTLKLARAALLEQQLTLPFRAPRSMFNVRIGGARRVAAQSYSFERINAVKSATGTTVNDVVLAMCAGALRAYLLDQNALPDAPLTAMVPVNLRKDDDDRGGNNVGTFLCNLATDLDDPAKRLEIISASIRDTKEVFWQLPPVQQLALSAFNIGGLFFGLIPGYLSAGSPPFNIVISNVSTGNSDQLYWRGARLDGNYPLSIPLDGQAVNITVTNNADNLDFGLVGCRRSVPHLQRMLGHLEASLKDLELVAGV